MKKARGVLIAGNWKMNHGLAETSAFFGKLGELARGSTRLPGAVAGGKLQACVIPPALCLARAQSDSAKLPFPVVIAAQNAHGEKKGAFTGEISGPLLAEQGISWALLGHSERRQYFGETDESVRKRAEGLLGQGFRLIVCVGESRTEREAGRTAEIIVRQMTGSLPLPGTPGAAHLDGRLVIAYEPVWAIGTGLTATPEQAEEAHQIARKLLWDRFGLEASGRTPLLYGGSVTPENIDSLLACANVDGALVGGASLKAEGYFALLEAGARAV